MMWYEKKRYKNREESAVTLQIKQSKNSTNINFEEEDEDDEGSTVPYFILVRGGWRWAFTIISSMIICTSSIIIIASVVFLLLFTNGINKRRRRNIFFYIVVVAIKEKVYVSMDVYGCSPMGGPGRVHQFHLFILLLCIIMCRVSYFISCHRTKPTECTYICDSNYIILWNF